MTPRDASRPSNEDNNTGDQGDQGADETDLVAVLRERQARLQLAVDAAQMGTFVWFPQDDRGEPDARMRALFGVPPGGTLNLAEALSTMIHPDDREMYARAVAKAIDPNGDGTLFAE